MNTMQTFGKKLLTRLAPVLGAGAIGVCPLCWIGSASFLTYVGLGVLIPVWRWMAFGLIALGAAGFILDYRSHKNPKPLMLLVVGAILLYVGRYVFLSTWGAWYIWGPGALIIIASILYNKSLFKKPDSIRPRIYSCPVCKLKYEDEAWAKKCEVWCVEHRSCNLDIIRHAVR